MGCDSRTLYKLLFGAVADTLNVFATNPDLGRTPSFTLVLHTWKQTLGGISMFIHQVGRAKARLG